MPGPLSEARTIFTTVAVVLLAIAAKLAFSISITRPHFIYVPAVAPEQGMQNWAPTRQHIARGVS